MNQSLDGFTMLDSARVPTRNLRSAFGCFASGVTVVTLRDDAGEPAGLTVNSFSSLSLDPPLLMFSVGCQQVSCRWFESRPHFNVNVLGARQESLAWQFAQPLTDKFAGVDWHAGTNRMPVLAGAIAVAPLAPGIGDRLADLGEGTTLRGTPGNSLTWRIDYWGDVIDAGEGRRVTGLGLGVASDVTVQQREPHNDLVRAYVEMGGIGLAAYLGFLLAIGWQVRRSLAQTRPATRPPDLPRALAEGYAGIFAAYLVGSLTGNLMTQLALLWYLLAVAAAAGLAARPSREPADLRGVRALAEPAHG